MQYDLEILILLLDFLVYWLSANNNCKPYTMTLSYRYRDKESKQENRQNIGVHCAEPHSLRFLTLWLIPLYSSRILSIQTN